MRARAVGCLGPSLRHGFTSMLCWNLPVPLAGCELGLSAVEPVHWHVVSGSLMQSCICLCACELAAQGQMINAASHASKAAHFCEPCVVAVKHRWGQLMVHCVCLLAVPEPAEPCRVLMQWPRG